MSYFHSPKIRKKRLITNDFTLFIAPYRASFSHFTLQGD